MVTTSVKTTTTYSPNYTTHTHTHIHARTTQGSTGMSIHMFFSYLHHPCPEQLLAQSFTEQSSVMKGGAHWH